MTPSVVLSRISAFGFVQQKHSRQDRNSIFVGRDSRLSGPWIESMVTGILAAQGFDVKVVGIVPTPTIQLLVIKEKAIGGIIITSSHNPVEWNGLKFVDEDGLFLSPELCLQLFQVALDEQKLAQTWAPWSNPGKIIFKTDAIKIHLDQIFSLAFVDEQIVKAKKYRVCLDTINGAGGEIMKALLERMGCEVIGLNLEATGLFAHQPEPIESNLNELSESVKFNKADFGIAVDPDVDRCVLIDETGQVIGEEYTLAIATEYLLGHCCKRGPVVKNLSTSRVIDHIAQKYNCPVISTPVGEIHVAKAMVQSKAVIGGEGNGGVMLPDIHIGRDAPVAASLFLMQLAYSGLTLSQFKATLPQWNIVKFKTSVQGLDLKSILTSIKLDWLKMGATISDIDGIRIDTESFWVHIRPSNTEPIVRIIGESQDINHITSICNEFLNQIKNSVF